MAVPLIGRPLKLHQYQEMVWGLPEPSVVKPIPKEISTANYLFKVFETPGHSLIISLYMSRSRVGLSPGICLYRRAKKFFGPTKMSI